MSNCMEISPMYAAVILQRCTDAGMECVKANAEHEGQS